MFAVQVGSARLHERMSPRGDVKTAVVYCDFTRALTTYVRRIDDYYTVTYYKTIVEASGHVHSIKVSTIKHYNECANQLYLDNLTYNVQLFFNGDFRQA